MNSEYGNIKRTDYSLANLYHDSIGVSLGHSSSHFFIDGVEVTQAIQYYHAEQHLTDPLDRGPDNSIPLIAHKPAWVRVYVNGGLLPAPVTGTIELQRLFNFYSDFQTLVTLSPQTPGILSPAILPNYDFRRSTLNSTLNFVIPAEFMLGWLRLKVRLHAGFHSDGISVHFKVSLRQTLRLAGIMVGYNGPTSPTNPTNINLPTPTLNDLRNTSFLAVTIMPVQSQATYRTAGQIILNVPLNDPHTPGSCSVNWDSLIGLIEMSRDNDGNHTDVIYYGLLANGIPIGPVVGCGGSVGSSSVGNQGTMTHELGHILGFPHSPCGNPMRIDPNYPAYEPYDTISNLTASIGEYGLDINDGTIWSPDTTKDIMSYCGPRWTSLYHYKGLVLKPLLDPVSVGRPKFWPPSPHWPFDLPMVEQKKSSNESPEIPVVLQFKTIFHSFISLIGLMLSDKKIEMLSIARLEISSQILNSYRTEFVAELIDKDGVVITSSPLYSLPSSTHGPCICSLDDKPDNTPFLFRAFLPNVAAGNTLRIRKDQEIIWIREAPSKQLKIQSFQAKIRGSNVLTIKWRTSSKESDTWLQWSPNKGKDWFGLIVGLKDRQAEIDISSLPTGTLYFRILSHDGFFTDTSKPVSVKVPDRDPSVIIFNPRQSASIRANTTMRLFGVGTDSSNKAIDPGSARWLIDDKEVGRGFDIFVITPSEGKHSCTLIVTKDRKSVKHTVMFNTLR